MPIRYEYPGEVNGPRGPAGILEIRLPTLFGKARHNDDLRKADLNIPDEPVTAD